MHYCSAMKTNGGVHSLAATRRVSVIGTALAIAVGLFLPTAASAAPPAPPVGKHWSPAFSDEFNGSSLNATNWSSCYHWYNSAYQGCTNAGNNELEWYKPSQVSVGGGYATLTAARTNTIGVVKDSAGNDVVKTFPYRSGMISTGGSQWMDPAKRAILYGYVEARIRVPEGRGLWPAFWMLSADYAWPPEIDIMEILGNDTSTTHMNVHWLASGAHQQDGSSFTNATPLSGGWHTFAVDWQPGKMIWYVDGVARKTLTSSGVPSQPMYILLNLAVGGDWPGSPDSSTVFPAKMDIDYVRTYDLVTGS